MKLTKAMLTLSTITRILSVVDTRQYEEQGDRWVPIPGSGDVAQCARCGRDHEVHATVELADGSCAVVGTGCMGAASLVREARSLASRAQRIRRLGAELASVERALETARAVWRAVEVMTPPPVKAYTDPTLGPALRCGDVDGVLCQSWCDMAERHACVVSNWRERRAAERMDGRVSVHALAYRVEDLRLRLARLA